MELENCLCEGHKYFRFRSQTGRFKQYYNGEGASQVYRDNLKKCKLLTNAGLKGYKVVKLTPQLPAPPPHPLPTPSLMPSSQHLLNTLEAQKHVFTRGENTVSSSRNSRTLFLASSLSAMLRERMNNQPPETAAAMVTAVRDAMLAVGRLPASLPFNFSAAAATAAATAAVEASLLSH
jgi:hypothetical protein